MLTHKWSDKRLCKGWRGKSLGVPAWWETIWWYPGLCSSDIKQYLDLVSELAHCIRNESKMFLRQHSQRRSWLGLAPSDGGWTLKGGFGF